MLVILAAFWNGKNYRTIQKKNTKREKNFWFLSNFQVIFFKICFQICLFYYDYQICLISILFFSSFYHDIEKNDNNLKNFVVLFLRLWSDHSVALAQ